MSLTTKENSSTIKNNFIFLLAYFMPSMVLTRFFSLPQQPFEVDTIIAYSE